MKSTVKKMEKLDVEFVGASDGEVLVYIKNFPNEDTTLSQKEIWSIVEDLILASSQINEITDLM